MSKLTHYQFVEFLVPTEEDSQQCGNERMGPRNNTRQNHNNNNEIMFFVRVRTKTEFIIRSRAVGT